MCGQAIFAFCTVSSSVTPSLFDIFDFNHHYSSYLNYLTYSAYLDNYLSFFGLLELFDSSSSFCVEAGWLESVGSRVLYELDPKKPVLYVVPVEAILEKLPVVAVQVGDLERCRMVWACHSPAR